MFWVMGLVLMVLCGYAVSRWVYVVRMRQQPDTVGLSVPPSLSVSVTVTKPHKRMES
jgi:hypothetical protein